MTTREYPRAVLVHAPTCPDAPRGLINQPTPEIARAHPHGRMHHCYHFSVQAPLPAIAGAWRQTRFVPHGATDDPDVAHTTSLVDYLARRLTLDFSPTGPGAETMPRGDQITR